MFLLFLLLLFNSFTYIFSFNPNIHHKIITVHKIKNKQCGQAYIKDIYFDKAKYFSKIEKGSCRSCGYKKYIGKKIHKFPFIGEIMILKYIKTSDKKCNDDECEL